MQNSIVFSDYHLNLKLPFRPLFSAEQNFHLIPWSCCKHWWDYPLRKEIISKHFPDGKVLLHTLPKIRQRIPLLPEKDAAPADTLILLCPASPLRQEVVQYPWAQTGWAQCFSWKNCIGSISLTLAFVRELRTQGDLSSRKSLNAKRSSEVYSSDGKSIQFIKAEEVRPSHAKKGFSKEANPGNYCTFTAKTFVFFLNTPSPPA